MIRCRDIVFQYPGEAFALRLGELLVSKEESLGVVGPSGCGKTTLLRLIAGILVPESGEISVDGEAVSRVSRALIASVEERLVEKAS